MCDYCKNKKELLSCNYGGKGRIKIIKNELDVYEDGRINNLFFKKITVPTFIIKYCPICGEKIIKE